MTRIITAAEAKRLGINLESWADLGLDVTKSYAVVQDPRDPSGSLDDYYATEALAKTAADALTDGAGRWTILCNPDVT